MLQAPFLSPGDRIRIVSPAGKIDPAKINPGIELLKQAGYKIETGKHYADSFYQFAATDEQRLQDLQEALDDDTCSAIICSRGGYGSIRIADQLDWSRFCKSPKWLVGFSDITVFHALLQQQGFQSIHGPMPGFFLNDGKPSESYEMLLQILQGQTPSIQFDPFPLNRNGHATGELIGGNLSIVYSLLGTPWFPDTTGKILFIEDLTEYLYHLDRMMHSLKLAGKLAGISALLVGQFTEMKDNASPFGQSVEEIILASVADYDFPVYFNCPSGHITENMPLVLGRNYALTVHDSRVQLKAI